MELDTVLRPGLVPTTCKAARNTLAVGLAEPATMPSTTPRCTNIAPKNKQSPSIVAFAFQESYLFSAFFYENVDHFR